MLKHFQENAQRPAIRPLQTQQNLGRYWRSRMPTYEYECEDCRYKFELKQNIDAPPPQQMPGVRREGPEGYSRKPLLLQSENTSRSPRTSPGPRGTLGKGGGMMPVWIIITIFLGLSLVYIIDIFTGYLLRQLAEKLEKEDEVRNE